MFVGAKGFSLCLPDLWNLQTSMLFNIAYGYGHAIAKTTAGLYIGKLIVKVHYSHWKYVDQARKNKHTNIK